jgi:hypothetical protein
MVLPEVVLPQVKEDMPVAEAEDKESRKLLLTMKLSPSEFRILAKAAGRMPVSMWARSRLLEAAKRPRASLLEAYRFTASRGGHAPGHLREALAEYITMGLEGHVKTSHTSRECKRLGCTTLSALVEVGDEKKPIEWLLGQLWNCRDILPGQVCSELMGLLNTDSEPATYAQAVRLIASQLEGRR